LGALIGWRSQRLLDVWGRLKSKPRAI